MRSQVTNDLGHGFYDAFRKGRFTGDLSFPIDSITLDDAYLIQDRALLLRLADGERFVGYKVGCTSEAIRRQFDLKQPVCGRLLAPHIHSPKQPLDWNMYTNCAIEPEFVFSIGQDLTSATSSRLDLIEAIEWVAAGIEVHNYKFWYSPPTSQELISSNGIHACLVVGPERKLPQELDFKSEIFRVHLDDTPVAEGSAAEIMGDAIDSLAWLVRHLAKRGEALKRGELIIPGSPVRLIEINRDCTAKVEISRVGSFAMEFISKGHDHN